MMQKTIFTLLFLVSTSLLRAQNQNEPIIEQKGDNYIVSLNGKKVEIGISKKTGKKVLVGKYFPHLFAGSKTGKPDKSKPLEADKIVYIHELGLVGFSLQKDKPRAYEIFDHKNNFQEGKTNYNPLRDAGVATYVEIPLKLPGGDEEVGFVSWTFDIQTEKAKQKFYQFGYETFIIRKGIAPNGITADKAFYFEITANDPPKRISKAEAHLYHGNTKIHSWNVENLRQNFARIKRTDHSSFTYSSKYILPNFVFIDKRENNGYLQFGIEDGENINLVTINPELEVSSIRKNIYFTSTLEDQPDLAYETIIPKVSISTGAVFPYPTGRRYRKLVFTPFIALEPHLDLEGVFLPINSKGEYMLQDDNIIGVTPVTMVANQQNTRAKEDENDKHLMVLNWMVAYKQKNELLWGWASPEFGYLTPPIWKDWDIYEDMERTGHFRKFQIKEGQYSIVVKMLDGPILVCQLLNNNWQMYVQPNLIDFAGTFDKPNTFAGKIPGGNSYEEAVKKGEQWLSAASRQKHSEYSRALKPIVDKVVAKNTEDFKRSEIVRKEFEARLEYIRNNPPPPRRYITSASYKGLEPSFTNTLRNISRTNSSNMATKSLNTVTNQMRQAAGKGYKR